VNRIISVALVLAAVGVADALLRWIVRRKVQRDESTADAPDRELLAWLDRGLKAAVPPMSVLIWVLGSYAALSMALTGLPESSTITLVLEAATWGRGAGTMVALFWLLSRIGRVIETGFGVYAQRSTTAWDDALLPVAGTAARVLLPILALILGVQALSIPPGYEALLATGLSVVLIGVAGFLLSRCVGVVAALVLQNYRIDVSDNLQARAIHTQVMVIRKIANTVIAIFALASMLMMFESVRQLGTSILASAGIASLIVGFAAQRSIATMLAGLQIAITQPIRVDDVVIVENEWGKIEEITLTYVVVRIWDERRLVLPITYFIEQPFQNWTRTSAQLLATVFLHVDYRSPLEAIRQELTRILEESPYWDRRVNVLQVTNAREQTVEIRALASAADASLAWDLRCEVREKLIDFLQRHHPEGLPRLRAELQRAEEGAQHR
jgi:small-conductance mechanosensitive channel